MKKMGAALKFIYGCFAVILDPGKTDIVASVAHTIAKPERFQETISVVKGLPGGAEMLEKKPLVPPIDLDQLQKLAQDTFGYRYAEFMKTNNLDPNIYQLPFHDDITYIFYRYGKVHDLWHVMAGFDTSLQGEIGVLAHNYAQNFGAGAMLIISLLFMHVIFFKPHLMKSCVESFVKGWTLGSQTKHLIALEWTDLFPRPYNEVRREMGYA